VIAADRHEYCYDRDTTRCGQPGIADNIIGAM
jgi:hypothetical protein